MQSPTIIFQDDSILVLNKPSGMTVNNADTTKGEETVQGWLLSVMPNLFRHLPRIEKKILNQVQNDKEEYDIEDEFRSRGGIVHRLDKETSGILLVAKNPKSFGLLKEQFMERTVKKTYIALAHGIIVPRTGEINVPIGRLPFNRTHFGVIAGGRNAISNYRVLSNYQLLTTKNKSETLTFVEVLPQTGRTHQIRVHLKYLGHPIFSDELYAGRKTAKEDRKYLPRIFLHAAKISFIHPITKKQMDVESPLPQDLQSFISNLSIINS